MQVLDSIFAVLREHPWLLTAIRAIVLTAAVWLSNQITHSLLLRLIGRAMRSMPAGWYEALIGHGVIQRLAHAVPALVIYYGVGYMSHLPEDIALVVRGVASAYVVLTIALALSRLLDAVGALYEEMDHERAQARPIKGYLQLLRIGVFMVAGILVIAALFNRDPLLLLSGLGAMTAVLLLVFKDTLLSLVASMQLAGNDMLHVGDWIEMPALNADGDVIDISLHTVKVRNWDKTITTIPTWRLINESFKNWRGMTESGGRRIKRALYLDQSSVRFLSDAERDRLARFTLLVPYLETKRTEIAEYNKTLLASGQDRVNGRHVTNIGTFRAYAEAYLRAHPRVHHEMTCMVRQLQPGPTGLPLEMYCFTSTTVWAEYEGIQADIFDHLYSILPEFDLRVFQQPGGADVIRALRRAGAVPGE